MLLLYSGVCTYLIMNFTYLFCRQEFTTLMGAINGGASSSGLTSGAYMNGLTRSGSFGSPRASTPSPTMGTS